MAELRPFDVLLAADVRASCEQARSLSLAGRLPTREVPSLVRTPRGLEAGSRETPDWDAVLATLSRERPGFWPHMAKLAAALSHDPHVQAAIGWEPDPERQAEPLWRSAIGPIVVQYAHRRADWSWDPELAGGLIDAWRASHGMENEQLRTLAPLHNLRGTAEEIQIDGDLHIRQLTDRDRDELWRRFGAGGSGPIAPTVAQLEAWTDAIDLRWARPKRSPPSDEPAIARVADVVTALRLHHPGVTGTTVLWTHTDPPDAPGHTGQRLYAPHGAGLYMHPLQTHVGAGDAASLRSLVLALRAARQDRRLSRTPPLRQRV